VTSDNTQKGVARVRPLFDDYNRKGFRTIEPASVDDILGIKLYLDDEICKEVFDGFAEYLFNSTYPDKKTKEGKL
jgi:hypothetical protein